VVHFEQKVKSPDAFSGPGRHARPVQLDQETCAKPMARSPTWLPGGLHRAGWQYSARVRSRSPRCSSTALPARYRTACSGKSRRSARATAARSESTPLAELRAFV